MKILTRMGTVLRCVLVMLGLSAASSVAIGRVVDDLTLSQSLLGGRRIVAYLHGQLPGQCTMVTNVAAGHPPLRLANNQIDIHLGMREAFIDACASTL